MAGSSFGTIFKVTTWGESHGKAIGAVADGVPAGIPLCEEDIQKYLDKRKPGQNKYTTARSESDAVEILSGVSKAKRPEPLSRFWFAIQTSVPEITVRSASCTVPDTQTIHMTASTVSVITAEAAVLRDARRSGALLQAQSQ